MIGYPKWFTNKLINTIFFLSFATGALLIPTVLILNLEWDFPWRLAPEQRDWVVIGHVALGFTVFTLLGALASVHMRIGFRKKQKRLSGVSLVALIIALGVTGLGILYIGDEELSINAKVVHFLLGLTLTVFYILHLLIKPKVQLKTKPKA